MVPTKDSRLPAAEICRRNDWRAGTKLVGDEGYGPTVIEITAVGIQEILARQLSHNGVDEPCPGETLWGLENRDWKVVS